MTKVTAPNGDVFEHEQSVSLLEVTSNHRPDTRWRAIDPAGHEHRWYVNGQPADTYKPEASYETPTLVWVKTGEIFYEDDDEPTPIGEYRCVQCDAVVTRGFTADDTSQFIPGLKREVCVINDERVTPQEFTRRWLAAHG